MVTKAEVSVMVGSSSLKSELTRNLFWFACSGSLFTAIKGSSFNSRILSTASF